MATQKKATQSEIDGVQYRSAKLWQIILYSCSSMSGMGVMVLTGMASYSASVGYGIATTVLGLILTCTRILDAVTDPLLAFVYDKVNTRFGKVRILMITGYLVEAAALLCMFHILSSKGNGIFTFCLCYVIYIIGYTTINMTAQTIPALMTNDPKQRPMISVWLTVFNYLTPVTLNLVLTMILLPRCGNEYNQAFLSSACIICLAVCAAGVVLSCIGVSAYDKPENFASLKKNDSKLKISDMLDVLKHNRPLQCYIASAASDKIATQVTSQSICATLLYGILIGNMGMSAILNMVGMIPCLVFAVIGARYAGKHGSKKAIVVWTWVCLIVAVAAIVFFVAVNPQDIASFGLPMILFVLITFALNGAKLCVTTANSSFMNDIIDYELDRNGNFVPAVVTGTYSLIDKLVSSFGAAIATGMVSLVGYVNTVPQPTDASTPGIFWVTMIMFYMFPILGWITTIIAMRFCKLDREEMVEVQKRIEKKKALLAQDA